MWVSIIASLGGAFLGSVIGPWILDWWFKPRIQVSSADEVLRERGVLYHRVAITNRGRRELRSCVSAISIRNMAYDDIAATAKKQVITPEDFRSKSHMENELLHWSTLGHGSSQNINPKVTAKLDLYRVLLSSDGKPDLIQIPSEQGWEPLKISLRPRALPYDGKVVISGANTEPREVDFKFVTAEDDVHFVMK
jgi:hypothetical protein